MKHISIANIKLALANGNIQDLLTRMNRQELSTSVMDSEFEIYNAYYDKPCDLFFISGCFQDSKKKERYWYFLTKKKLEDSFLNFNPLQLQSDIDRKRVFELISGKLDNRFENVLAESKEKITKVESELSKTKKELKRLKRKTKNLNLVTLKKIRKSMLHSNKANNIQSEIENLYLELDDYKETSKKYKEISEKIQKMESEKKSYEGKIIYNNELELHEIDRKTSINQYLQERKDRVTRIKKINEYLNKRKTRKS